MNGIGYALRRIHHGENEMHLQLLRIAEREHAEHEIHHVARDLAAWSEEHVRELAAQAERFEVDLSGDADTPSAVLERLRAAASTLAGRRAQAGLLLLHDLRDLYLQASDNSLAWEMLAQVAQAKRERELLALTERCHPQNLRQLRWANTMIKVQTPQILNSMG
jgi:hypothetical protein